MTPQEIKIMVGHNKLKEAAEILQNRKIDVSKELALIDEWQELRQNALDEKRTLNTEESNTLFRLSDEVSWSLIQKCNEL